MWSAASPHIRGHSSVPSPACRTRASPSLRHTSRAGSRPAHPLSVWGDPTAAGEREVPLQSASTERRRPKAVGRQKEAVDGGGRPRLPRPFKVPFSPAAFREEEPAAGGGRPCHPPELRRGGPLPKAPFQPSASAQRGSPTACLLPALCPLYPASPLPPHGFCRERKKEPRPPQRGRRALLKRLGRPFRERCPIPTGSRCRGPGPFAGWRWASPRRAGGGRRTPRAGRSRPRQRRGRRSAPGGSSGRRWPRKPHRARTARR